MAILRTGHVIFQFYYSPFRVLSLMSNRRELRFKIHEETIHVLPNKREKKVGCVILPIPGNGTVSIYHVLSVLGTVLNRTL